MPKILEETTSKSKVSSLVDKPSNRLFIYSSIKVYLIVLIINSILILPAYYLGSSYQNNKNELQGLVYLFGLPLLGYVAFAMYLPLYSAFLIFVVGILNTIKYKPHHFLATTIIIFSTLAMYYGNNIILLGYSLSQQTKHDNVFSVKEKPIEIVLIDEKFILSESNPSYQATYKILNKEKKSGKLRLNCEVFKLIENPSRSEIILSSLSTTINIKVKDEIVDLRSPINFDNTKRLSLISDNKNIYTKCFMDLSNRYGFGIGSKSTSWPFHIINIDPNIIRVNWQQLYKDY